MVETTISFDGAHKSLAAGIWRCEYWYKADGKSRRGEWGGMLGEHTGEVSFGIVLDTKDGGCATMPQQLFQTRRYTHTDLWWIEKKTVQDLRQPMYLGSGDKDWSLAIATLVRNPYSIPQFQRLTKEQYDKKPIMTYMVGYMHVEEAKRRFTKEGKTKVPLVQLYPMSDLEPLVDIINKQRATGQYIIDLADFDGDGEILKRFGQYPPACPILKDNPLPWRYTKK